MPIVPYYQGRPARAWVEAGRGSGTTQSAAATMASPAAPCPAAAPVASQAARGGSAIPTAASSAWAAWASHWFTPSRPASADHGRA
jgi:hypothetical protein